MKSAKPTAVSGKQARRHAERLVLHPLDRAEVAAQVRAITGVAPPAAMVDQMLARAAGNPFFTEELLAAGTGGDAMPATVRDVLLTRAARLPAPGRRVLQAAAVLGRSVRHELLVAITDPADLDAGLPAAVAHRLLEPRGDGYLFRHPLIQETVYADVLPAVRRDLHARAAARLEATSEAETVTELAGHAVQVAYHWRAAGATGRALGAAVRAGQLAAAAHAPAEALAWYEYALVAWPAVPGAAGVAGMEQLTLMERAAETASVAGDNTRAQVLARQVLARIDPAAEPLRADRGPGRLVACLRASSQHGPGAAIGGAGPRTRGHRAKPDAALAAPVRARLCRAGHRRLPRGRRPRRGRPRPEHAGLQPGRARPRRRGYRAARRGPGDGPASRR